MAKTVRIEIPKGIKVLSADKRGLVTLLDAIEVDAVRMRDGGYEYTLDRSRYYVSAGNVTVNKCRSGCHFWSNGSCWADFAAC